MLQKGNTINVLYDERDIGGSQYWAWSIYNPETDNIEEYPNIYKGIELNEEALQALGFICIFLDDGDVSVYTKSANEEYSVVYFSDGYCAIRNSTDRISMNENIMHVHTLQNFVKDKIGIDITCVLPY